MLIASLACGGAAAPATTAAPTGTSAPPTSTSRPTSTPRPTATPNLAATKQVEENNARIQSYFEKGYVSTTDGKIFKLADYDMEWAQINYFSDPTPSGYNELVKDFVFRADFHWENAVKNPETSGCGFIYRGQYNGDFYSAYLDTERVVMGGYAAAAGNFIRRFGVTTGSGKVDFGNPADANFTLILNGYMAYVLVNDKFIGSYTLYTEKLLNPGLTFYFVKSGTNKDFGTRCQITNATLWVPNQ